MTGLRAAGLALAVAACLPGPVQAQDEGIRFVRSMKKAFEIAKERGYPILVWSTMDSDTSSKADQETFRNKDVRKAMKGYLVLFAHHETGHPVVDGPLDGKPSKVCSIVPAMQCVDHKAAQDDIYRSYGDVAVDKAANLRTPNHFVVDGDGKVIGTINNGTKEAGFSEVPAPKMVEGLKALLAKAGGPGLSDEEYGKLQKALSDARASIDAHRMSEAARALAPFTGTGKRLTLLDTARELLARVDKEAAPALAKAQAVLKDDALGGLVGLDRVSEDYPGTESAVAAKKAADAFRASPEGKKVLKDLAREKEGRAELAKALEAGDGKDDAKFLRLLDGVAKKYAGLPCGNEAKAKAEAVRADPERAKALAAAAAEKDAKSALTAAKGLLDAGKKDEAKSALQAIVEKFPGTKGAEEATKLLEGLR
jgi:hypothetical protein